MKEKNTGKETVYGLVEGHRMPQGHSYGTLRARGGRSGSYPKLCHELLLCSWSHYFIFSNFSFSLIHGTRKWWLGKFSG